MTDTAESVQRAHPAVGAWRVPDRHTVVLAGLALAGAVAFGVGAAGVAPLRAWEAFLVNLLFFTGIAQANAVFLAILTLTKSRWGAPFERFAAASVTFLPIAFLLFLLLPLGREVLFPWVSEPIPAKAMWLNFTFMMVRDGLGLAILFALSLALVYQVVRPLAWSLRGSGGGWRQHLYAVLTQGFRGPEVERERAEGRIPPLALGLTATYALVFSLLAGDLIMSLDPHWYSSLFGAYNFVVSLHVGIAALAILSLVGRKRFGLEATMTRRQLHDVGKLIFAFCLIAGDFFWSQYLVIWYGNITEEASFLIARTHAQPWLALSVTVLLTLFVVPFFLLLSRAPKRNPLALGAIAGLVLIGGWLERYLLIVPSLTPPEEATIGVLEALITLAFLALFLLAYRAFLRAFPPDLAVTGGTIAELSPVGGQAVERR